MSETAFESHWLKGWNTRTFIIKTFPKIEHREGVYQLMQRERFLTPDFSASPEGRYCAGSYAAILAAFGK